MKTAAIIAGLAAMASALPAAPKMTERQMKIYNLQKRQTAAEQALGITDIDVLQL